MQKIDFNALIKNVEYFKRNIGNSKLCAVVKNDAYGHGLERVARYIAPVIDYFAVGNVDEAECISFLGKDTLILIPQNQVNTSKAIKLGCLLTVESFVTLLRVLDEAGKLGKVARVHIKIDSGMSRLGFTKQEIPKLLKILENVSSLAVEGVFSHFWGEKTVSCDKQLDYFIDCAEILQRGLNRHLIKHIANSSATLLNSKYHLDMVRVGLGLYGYGNDNICAVKTITSNVVAVKRVSAGEVVGYGGKYVCEKDTNIVVIDVGYAHGLSRTLVGSKVLIGEKLCEIIAICMAMSMVEIGDSKANIGDEVTLVGNGVNMSNDKVIIYELLCNLH